MSQACARVGGVASSHARVEAGERRARPHGVLFDSGGRSPDFSSVGSVKKMVLLSRGSGKGFVFFVSDLVASSSWAFTCSQGVESEGREVLTRT